MFYVYIIQSIESPDKTYIGCTHDIDKRLSNHNSGTTKHTKKYMPWKLITYTAFANKEIAYKLHSNNISMEEIIMKTKLDEYQIIETIKTRQNNPKKCKTITETKTLFSIESEIYEMKNDIKELKNTIKELVEMMKAVYEFEDA